MRNARSIIIATALIVSACAPEKDAGQADESAATVAEPGLAPVTGERIAAADAEPGNWLSHGRTYSEQRFSPLGEIDRENVGELGLAWYFDVPTERGMEATPIVVDGRMYVTGSWSILYALDAATGEELWRYDPAVPKTWAQYACCDVVNRGAAVWGDSVFIGTLDGYLVALDAMTGEVRWKVDTIDRKPPYTITGAPRVIDGLVVIGNGSPWNQRVRSPDGGDNLFLSSIVALRPATGEYVWHYQTTPGETWDFTATQHMILADLEIGGEPRKVLMQAPKNGFFYVLDRSNGALISADAYVGVTWATGVDPETGRPIEVPAARYGDEPVLVAPMGLGGHNWHPMAFSPVTKLVYVPTQDLAAPYAAEPGFEFTAGFWNTGIELEMLEPPDDPAVLAAIAEATRGQLVAWDPVAQREVWRFQHAGVWNGGVLATAGDLVFQGSLIGEFAAYDAETGDRLWRFPAQTGVAAAPIAYRADGRQHVAVAAGWGTIFSLLGGKDVAAAGFRNRSRILAFTLEGSASLPALAAPIRAAIPRPPERAADAEELAHGKDLYYERCVVCHGINVAGGGVLPDLRYASAQTHDTWDAIVLGGALQNTGMPGFGQIFDKTDSDAVHAFVIATARKDFEMQAAGTPQ